jgi:hypothetical protein
MGEVLPIPSAGDVFADVRGEDRTMRVSYHHDRDVVVVSLWAGAQCRGSFRMAVQDVERLVAVLTGVEVPVAASATEPAADPVTSEVGGTAHRSAVPPVLRLQVA